MPAQVSYPVDNTAGSAPTGTSWSSSFYHMAPTAPPAPRYEDVPIPDNPGAYAWHPGYWNYSGGDFSWVPGEMMDRPAPTALWSPDHWIQHTYGWALVPGYWQ